MHANLGRLRSRCLCSPAAVQKHMICMQAATSQTELTYLMLSAAALQRSSWSLTSLSDTACACSVKFWTVASAELPSRGRNCLYRDASCSGADLFASSTCAGASGRHTWFHACLCWALTAAPWQPFPVQPEHTCCRTRQPCSRCKDHPCCSCKLLSIWAHVLPHPLSSCWPCNRYL